MFLNLSAASRRRRLAARAIALNVMISAAAVMTSGFWTASDAEAKGPGRTYCFLKKCHRVKTIAETQALIGRDMTVIASHYDDCKKDRFNPCGLTSSGEPFFPERADNAASPVLPDGTIVLVWSKVSQQALVVRINNAGPYWGNRKLDLSKAAARKLGIGGVGEVTMRVVKAPTLAEARYSRNRRYERVPGPIGQFASLDEAQGAMAVMVAEGKTNAFAVADLALPAKRDATANLSSSSRSPVVPGFAIPKGALAEALIAQSNIERRVVTANLPPMTDVVSDVSSSTDGAAPVVAVAPKLKAARIVSPRRMRVRAVDVKPVVSDPLTAIVQAVTDLIEPPKVKRVARTSKTLSKRPTARVAAKATPQKRSVVAAAAMKPRRVAKARIVKEAPSTQFRAGHTTYSEDKYRKPVQVAATSSKKLAKVAKKSKSKAAAIASGAASKATKQAGVARGKKSAALKKTGGWQSSAIFDLPVTRPALTGSQPRVPAGDLRDDGETPRGPLRRVHPSALV